MALTADIGHRQRRKYDRAVLRLWLGSLLYCKSQAIPSRPLGDLRNVLKKKTWFFYKYICELLPSQLLGFQFVSSFNGMMGIWHVFAY